MLKIAYFQSKGTEVCKGLKLQVHLMNMIMKNKSAGALQYEKANELEESAAALKL